MPLRRELMSVYNGKVRASCWGKGGSGLPLCGPWLAGMCLGFMTAPRMHAIRHASAGGDGAYRLPDVHAVVPVSVTALAALAPCLSCSPPLLLLQTNCAAVLLYCRRDLFQLHNITEPPATWEELMELAARWAADHMGAHANAGACMRLRQERVEVVVGLLRS